MRRFGYFVTESSGHASEYLPYFRKRPDLLASLVETFESAGSDYSAWLGYGQTGGCVAGMRRGEPAYEQEVARQIAGTEPVEMRRSDEYGGRIIHSAETGTPLRINANVPNADLVTNLPTGACVEVPCLVDNAGVHPCVVGPSPTARLVEPEQYRRAGACRQGPPRAGPGGHLPGHGPRSAHRCRLFPGRDMEVDRRHVHGERALVDPVLLGGAECQ